MKVSIPEQLKKPRSSAHLAADRERDGMLAAGSGDGIIHPHGFLKKFGG